MLVKEGADVRVVMTPSSVNFVSPVTLAALSKNKVTINMFPEGDVSNAETIDTSTWHVDLGLWADLFVIAPATANTIGKIVQGISDNFLLTAVCAAKCDIIIAPTMDDDMYKNSTTQENILKLSQKGFRIIEPTEGELASGIHGMGRMAEPEEIVTNIKKYFERSKDLKGKKILITAGPTREYIDPVRFISNGSTGKMGFQLAKAAEERGADVTLITGPVDLTSSENIKRIDVLTADEMLDAVKNNISKTDAVIMTAAVEDLKPVSMSSSKIKKEKLNGKLDLEMEMSVDILKYLGENKNGFMLVGFALETDNEIENAKKKLVSKNLDLIVSNNAKIEGAGFGSDTNIITLITKDKAEKLEKMSKYDAGNKILDKIFSINTK